MLLKSSIHNIAWMFTNNRCVNEGFSIDLKPNESFEKIYHIEESEQICSEEVQSFNRSGLICRRRIFVEECICLARSGSESPTVIKIPATLAKLLVLGDCHKVILESSSLDERPNLQFIYLYRIDSLHIIELDPTLKQLHILYSNVHLNYANAFASPKFLDELRFSGSLLDNVGSEAFANSHINLLVFNGTTLRQVAANAFPSDIEIQRLELWDSDILDDAGNIEQGAKNVRIENSHFPVFKSIEKDCENIFSDLCLKNKDATNVISKRCAKNTEKDCLPYQLDNKSNKLEINIYYFFLLSLAFICQLKLIIEIL